MAKKTNKFKSIVDDPESGFTREEAIKEMAKAANTEQEIKETVNYAHQNLKQVGVSSPALNNEVKMEPDLELIVDGFNLSNSNDKDKIVTTQTVVLEDLKDPKPQVKEEEKEQPQIIEEYEVINDKKQNKNDLSADDIKIVAINFINRTVSRQPFFTSSIIADTASKLGEVKYSITTIDAYKMTKNLFIDKRKKLSLLNQHKFKILNQIISSESKAKAILYLDINSGLESIPEGINKKKTDLVVFKSEKSNEYFTSAIIFINNREKIIKMLAKENKLDDSIITKIKEAGYTVTEILAI